MSTRRPKPPTNVPWDTEYGSDVRMGCGGLLLVLLVLALLACSLIGGS